VRRATAGSHARLERAEQATSQLGRSEVLRARHWVGVLNSVCLLLFTAKGLSKQHRNLGEARCFVRGIGWECSTAFAYFFSLNRCSLFLERFKVIPTTFGSFNSGHRGSSGKRPQRLHGGMQAFDFPGGAQTRSRVKQLQDALSSAAIRGDIADLRAALAQEGVRLHHRCDWYDPAGIVRGQCPPNLQGHFHRTSFRDATPMHLACIGGHIHAVGLLINAGAMVSCRDAEHNTPLHIAAMFQHTGIAALLLLHGAKVDARGHDLDTPLHYAAFHVETDMAVLLIDHGADVDDSNFHEHDVFETRYETALYTAWVRDNVPMIRVLLDYGADIEKSFGPIGDGGLQTSFTALSLQNVNDAGPGHPNLPMYTRIYEMFVAEPGRREALRLSKCEAFAMGHHERLGADSRIVNLDAGVVRMIVERI
jgi:hypothetical protein